ncbi:hypothetical protein OJ996_20420 [Luteolibacter sp. GHJ8]|uniref:Uncharacterized protein n=1 Tax=Luteolibacter rhizosphaerae TaxID=2989719 RepID=A0ABT3G7Z1_9BACT|nr:hypothetical protein [Luteolibacter rhizosphaerae]MCW1915964.1 hypothetical protein [Luteolibacter rhizosphaerae]
MASPKYLRKERSARTAAIIFMILAFLIAIIVIGLLRKQPPREKSLERGGAEGVSESTSPAARDD